MRFVVLALSLVLGIARAHADPTGPIRVALECEDSGRTKACPAFLLGFIDANKVLIASPRAGADVDVYATATQIALIDRVHLRFVGHMPGAPPVVELDVEVNSRGTDDEQRGQLEPAFLRGIALFVGARHPEAVTVALTASAELAAAAANVGSPWGLEIGIGSSGSYTERYRSAAADLQLIGRWLHKRQRAFAGVFGNGGVNRQPALVLDDGTVVSLDSERWFVHAGAEYVALLDDSWSIGAGSYTNFEDAKGQFAYSNRSRVAIEWDKFSSDDPRGNRLGVFYSVGWMTERYHVRNEIGERFATYPIHGLTAVGTLRHDKIGVGLEMALDAQLLHPNLRRSLTVSPYVQIKLGDHVDLALSLSVTQRELPAPDANAIDPADYEQLSRLSYAEPLSISGSLSLRFHWDPSNGARNDRLGSI
jgi:hypothetical protein